MKVWLGHYNGNPKEWFVVWATCVEDAWDVVDQVGDVETHSLRELVSPGLANFHIDCKEEDVEGERITEQVISPAKDKTRRERWLILGDQSLLQNPNDYIAALYSERAANQKFHMRVWQGCYLPVGDKNNGDSFVVWAKNKEDAILMVEQSFGSLDKDSLVEIKNEGFVDFHVSYHAGQQVYTPPKEDIESGFWINLQGI